MEENIEILIEKMNKELDFLIENANKTEQLTATSIMTMKQPIILLFLSVLSNYQKVLKENEELENITDKMIDYIMIHQQVKTMRKIFCKHCKLQNSCTYSGIHRNCVIRYFEYISKQGNISKMHENLEKILESEE